MVKGRILWVDDDSDFLNVRSEFVQDAGYEVLKAGSIEEAEQVLQNNWVHLLILDMRLVDEDDEEDKRGLDWAAEREIYRFLPKIILTAHATKKDLQRVLHQQLAEAVLDKYDEPEKMVEDINAIFARQVHINLNLRIRWPRSHTPVHLLSVMEPELTDTRLFDYAAELEDLFRRLFYQYNQITITRLFTGRTKRITLAVHAFSDQNGEEEFVVVCGQRELVSKEAENYKLFLADSPRMILTKAIHFAAIAYVLPGASLAEAITLTEYYRHNSMEAVIGVINQLFEMLLVRYEKGRTSETEPNLKTFFLNWLGLREEALVPAALGAWQESIRRKALSAGLLKLEEPAFRLTTLLFKERKTLTSPFWCGLTYGRLDGEGVLVDGQGRPYLVDFSQVELGPLVRDFVMLETAVKFDLLATLDVQARQELEQRLWAGAHLGEAADTEDLAGDGLKALQVINCIRKFAAAGINNDLKAYQLGLYYNAVNQLADYDQHWQYSRHELARYFHAVLSTLEFLRQRSSPLRQDLPQAALKSLWIDRENQQVWVEGEEIELPPASYELLLFLYQRANQLCTFQIISQQVFTMNEYWTMKNTIQAAIRRLREKIEPDPNYPKYVINDRGRGYKLILNHTP